MTKIATYGSLGVLTSGSIVEGAAAGLGAMVAIWVTRQWLDQLQRDMVSPARHSADANKWTVDALAEPRAIVLIFARFRA